MNWSKEEYEVVMCFDPLDKKWEAYTNIPKYRNKFEKQGWIKKKVDYYRGQEIAWTFESPENGVTVRNPNKKRIISEEQRSAASQRMKKARTSET